MSDEVSRRGRFVVNGPPLDWKFDEAKQRHVPVENAPLPCAHWCLICKDIQRNMEPNPSVSDMGEPCDLCPDCSGVPEWTI